MATSLLELMNEELVTAQEGLTLWVPASAMDSSIWLSGAQSRLGVVARLASSGLATTQEVNGGLPPATLGGSLALCRGKVRSAGFLEGEYVLSMTGMSDYYRDRVRHGGILSNTFIKWWYDRQVGSNQYGLPGRTERSWGTDSLEGTLPAEELTANRADQSIDTACNRFLDDEYFRARVFNLEDVKVPVLSVANWGGIHLHLRGNVFGYMGAGSKYKYLRFITGRHDLPFFYDEEVEIQRSFLDACLKGVDRDGWLVPGKHPPVDLCLRRGNPGFNAPQAERRAFPRRLEQEWPIARTHYAKYHLTPNGKLSPETSVQEGTSSWPAPGGDVLFMTDPFEDEVEITGHPTVRLSVTLLLRDGSKPSEIDLFVTLRHFDPSGSQIFYTGAVGDPVPVARGWLRVSLRQTTKHPSSWSEIIPERDYLSTDVQDVCMDKVYTVDVEIWPTSVVLLPGERLGLQISSSDSEEAGIFEHNHPDDRPLHKLQGYNELRLSAQHDNYLRIPIIPSTQAT